MKNLENTVWYSPLESKQWLKVNILRAVFSGLAAVAVLTLLFPAAAFCGGATPEDTARNMQLGIDNADAALFEEQVNFAAIVGDSVDFMVRESKKPENAASVPPTLALIFSSIGESGEARERLMAIFTSETREFVIYGINSGAFAGKKVTTQARPGGFMAPLFADASMGRKQITITGQASPYGGSGSPLVALPVNVYDQESGYTYPVNLVMQKKQNGWIVEKIANLDQLYKQIRKESAATR